MRSSRTARRPAIPGVIRILSFRTFLPHQDAKITSGSRRATSAGIDDPVLRERRTGQLRENRRAAGDVDELFNPSDARDQRLVPLVEEDARPCRQRRFRLRGGCDRGPRSQTISQRFSLWLTPDEAAEHPDHLQNLGDRALVERDDREAAPHQFRRELRLQIRRTPARDPAVRA